jgi:phosphatidyl-myo-inositol alpha-mannosyltransferase
MTIGMLLDDTLDSADGVQQAIISIGNELTSRGHLVHYIAPTSERTDIPHIHSLGRVISLRFNGNSVRTPLPVSRKKVRQLFQDVDFDALHVQMPYSPLFSAKILKYAPDTVKKIGTFHILPYSFMSTYGTKLLGLFMRKSIRSLNSHIAVSEPSLVFMKNTFNVKGIVIPNPVVNEYYGSFTGKKHPKNNIVFVGRFEARKGVVELVEAYSKLPKEIRSNTKLIMCGRGPLFETVKQKISSLDLDVYLPGFVTDEKKAQYLADADIAVFPSKSGESFGIVLTEAMSARSGVVIGGNNPGYASVLGEWPETLFNPLDITEFSNKLELFLTDINLRNLIGKKQHEIVNKYDVKTVVDQLEGIYQPK